MELHHSTQPKSGLSSLSCEKRKSVTFSVTGKGLTALEWKEKEGLLISESAKQLILCPEYDMKHRLEQGKEYTVKLVHGTEIRNKKKRTIPDLYDKAIHEIGATAVSSLKGELAFLICEMLTREHMSRLRVWYIAVPHSPIKDSCGNSRILRISVIPKTEKIEVDTIIIRDNFHWQNWSAFAFMES